MVFCILTSCSLAIKVIPSASFLIHNGTLQLNLNRSLRGKTKSRYWKRSTCIYHENVPLGVFLSSIGVPAKGGSSPTPCPSPLGASGQLNHLVDPVLAFIKAYRLKGDHTGLKQAVLSTFDSTSLAAAHRSLWDVCKIDLELSGLSFHSRRWSEKRQLADILFADLMAAFDKLDCVEKVPPMFCEATDLIKLPTLVLDPVSKKLDT